MTKALWKAIMTRSRLKNVYLKNRNTANWNNYKYQRNFCTNLEAYGFSSIVILVYGNKSSHFIYIYIYIYIYTLYTYMTFISIYIYKYL